MKEIADELRARFRQAGAVAPASADLFAAVDERARRATSAGVA
jgi:hypothetical protein